MPQSTGRAAEYGDDRLLQAELDYIKQTAFQANEDRARVSSFYLVAVGSLVAAVFSAQLLDQRIDPRLLAWAFSILFFVLTMLGTLTTLQLARLRAAWHESMLAMNQLKEYWLRRSKDKHLREAFRWQTGTLPAKYKANSVSYFQALEVALLSGFTLGAGVFSLQQAIGYSCPACNWAYSIAFGIFGSLFQLFLYRRTLGETHVS